ncbi:5-formyltetrahydrofolate cyclo-ligase [Stackebrandtia soli]|uniref:5-formyltetrahydrofolate cyclo-ligase n=1 Tax=Stackebrandtia soli TaxID=1892856 RepID=UPI0039E83A3F
MDCSTDPPNRTFDAKETLRGRILTRRRTMTPVDRDEANLAIQRTVIVDLPTVLSSTVAAYSPLPTEPGGTRLAHALHEAGFRLLLPVLRDDLDLDWAEFTGELATTRRRLDEPPGPRLGPEAVREASIVLVPALAVGPDGARLGRGGGSFDRALARVATTTPVIAVLFDGEWPLPVPSEPHDAPVSHVVTPSGGLTPVGDVR